MRQFVGNDNSMVFPNLKAKMIVLAIKTYFKTHSCEIQIIIHEEAVFCIEP